MDMCAEFLRKRKLPHQLRRNSSSVFDPAHDSIKVMTLHVSKGLEFPIVFIPMMNKNRDSEFTNWFDTNENEALKSVNINQFSKNLEAYDDEILFFNTKNSYKNLIDRLCLQYVATTRPVEQLFFYLQKEYNKYSRLHFG